MSTSTIATVSTAHVPTSEDTHTNPQEGTAMPTFDTPGPISATVDIVFGNVRFRASDRTDTVVEVRPADPTWDLDVKAAEEIEIELTDGKLQARYPKKLRTGWFNSEYGSVEVLVELPTGSDVRGDTAKGGFVVEGAVGSCQLKTPTGEIRVERAAGVKLKTTSGTVTVDHVTGQADVSGNGAIGLHRVDGGAVVRNIGGGDSWVGEVAGDLRASSANGHVTVDVARAAVRIRATAGDVRVGEIGGGTVDLSTAAGEVTIGVPEGTEAQLDAHTTAGRVRDNQKAPERPDRTVKVRARSHGGDIVVHRA